MKQRVCWVVCSLALCVMLVWQPALSDPLVEIPPQLEAWRAWVLYDHEAALCPGQFDDTTVTRCQWPSHLRLEIAADGARFEQHWLIFAPGWVALPGSGVLWPEAVVLDGQPVAVVPHDNSPAIWVLPGEHRIQGRFFWQQMPEILYVPPSLGLLSMSLDGQEAASPLLDDQNRLWLKQRQTSEDAQDRVMVKVFRLFKDTIPMQMTTLLRVDVSGSTRDIQIDRSLLEGCVPMALESALPARFDTQGRLVIQARPGQWEIRIVARMTGPQLKIAAGKTDYGQEVWSFEPQHPLRMVEIAGVTPIEPGQTEMPAQWRSFPAYLVNTGEAMSFTEIRRGDPDPAPDQLTLRRTWWLDFAGQGYTVHDQIAGTLSRQWYLAVNPPMVLGRVSVDGRDQVITVQGDKDKAGVQLRGGQLNLQADARWPERSCSMAVVGWDHDFQQVAGVLNLPPGWRLLATSGVDQVSSTWLQRWSLLDFFLSLMIATGVVKLRNWKWGVLALVVMVLIFDEPDAPRLVWLHLLAVLAVLPLLPAGWMRRCVVTWGIGAMAVLLITAVPFAVNQIRWGIYPQLAPHGDTVFPVFEETEPSAPTERERQAADHAPARPAPGLRRQKALSSELLSVPASPASAPAIERQAQDPDILIPTGPGLPQWQWQTVSLGWNGPLAKDQTMRFYLLAPWMNLVLALARVVLLALLITGIADWRAWWRKAKLHFSVGALLVVLAVCAVAPVPVHAADTEAGFPPPQMLEELRRRLLKKPDCLPFCADIQRLELTLVEDRIQVMLKVHAADRTAVPLPVNRASWTPAQILLDNAIISGLARDDSGQLWAMVPAGMHTIVLLGTTSGQPVVQIPMSLKPHTASVQAPGWEIKGLTSNGGVAAAVQLSRAQDDQAVHAEEKAMILQPFLHVERTLRLGLTWQVITRVRRMTPVGVPIVLSIPLLAGESVTTPGIQVEQGAVALNLAPDQQEMSYSATLAITPTIELAAPSSVLWTETWVLDAATLWQCTLEGIAPIHHQDRSGQWRPQWQPWPGERVAIRISRPPAVAGQTKTIDQADLVLTPGRRFSAGELTLAIRVSRGGQHTLALPGDANLQSVQVDGRSLPVRQDGRWVTVPLNPGSQNVVVSWRQPAAFSALWHGPELKPGQETVNARLTLQMPADRWILLAGGPRWGPAVLFWSYLVVIVLAAVLLGRMTLTPLKTWQWVLLGLGLTQIPSFMALVIVGWLVALGVKARHAMPDHWLPFNFIQLTLVVWTLAALVCLFAAVKGGLVGEPQMHITGNASSYLSLHWTQDHTVDLLPQPWVFSLPVWVYRGLMLAWSFWLALALLSWLRWGWRSFVGQGVWRKALFRWKKNMPKTTSETGTQS